MFFCCNLIYFTPWYTDVPTLLNHVWLKYTCLSLLQKKTSCFQYSLVILVSHHTMPFGKGSVNKYGSVCNYYRSFFHETLHMWARIDEEHNWKEKNVYFSNMKKIIKPVKWCYKLCYSTTNQGLSKFQQIERDLPLKWCCSKIIFHGRFFLKMYNCQINNFCDF
jgi:hypothetical protein